MAMGRMVLVYQKYMGKWVLVDKRCAKLKDLPRQYVYPKKTKDGIEYLIVVVPSDEC